MVAVVTRDQLARFLHDNDTIRKFEALFQQVMQENPQNLEVIFRLLQETITDAGTAHSTADQANASLERIASSLDLLVGAPRFEPHPAPDNLSPPIQIGTIGEQQADRVRITGGTIDASTLGAATPAAATATVLTSTGATVVGTLLNLSGAAAGQIQFPATQNPSANANTLDDYEEGTWTPVVTFATPGNLAVTYGAQAGIYVKIGRQVFLNWMIQTTTFTHTTASGALLITGLPFTPGGIAQTPAKLDWQGITFAGFTEMAGVIISGSTQIQVIASGSAQARTNVTAPNVPTGGNVSLIGQAHYSV